MPHTIHGMYALACRCCYMCQDRADAGSACLRAESYRGDALSLCCRYGLFPDVCGYLLYNDRHLKQADRMFHTVRLYKCCHLVLLSQDIKTRPVYLITFLPFFIIRPFALSLTRCPATLYAGVLTVLSASMALIPVPSP